MSGRAVAKSIVDQYVDTMLADLQQHVRDTDTSTPDKHLAFSMVMSEVSRRAYALSHIHQKQANKDGS